MVSSVSALPVSQLDKVPENPTSSVSLPSVSYNPLERFFRTSVFRLGVYQAGFLEKALIYLYRSFLQKTFFPDLFDEARAEKSLSVFKSLGAKEHFTLPRDGHARIHMMTLRAEDFEKVLSSKGASWQRIETMDPVTKEKKTIIAIIPPNLIVDSPECQAWKQFESESLLKMGWNKQTITQINGLQKEVIVTCSDADLVPEVGEKDRRCFLYTHSTSASFIRDRARAGMYLGMKQDLCFYDNRGIWKSKGIPSEAAYYLDLESVYQKMQQVHFYDPKQIWIVGYCGGAPVAAHLKALLHTLGVNFMEEHSFSSFTRDFIDSLDSLAKWLGHQLLPSLFARDMDGLSEKPRECAYSVEELWKNLRPYHGTGGKVILMHPTNDQRLTTDVAKRFETLAKKVNEAVSLLFYTSPPEKDAHSDEFFHYPVPRRQFTQAVFC